MTLHHLDSHTLHAAFLAACDAVVVHREQLNAINLFPVADGDTGDNMAATALSVIHHSTAKPTLKETFHSLANSALIGARGNSGMIFSQFFSGLTETDALSDQIDTSAFAELINTASKSVRSAILHPVEGTIITVIDAWSASAHKLAQEHKCFGQLVHHSLTEVDKALQSTTVTLPVLQEAQVVDAGALGFYHFISGFANYLANPQNLVKNYEHLDCSEPHHALPANGLPPVHRYCTEITLTGSTIDRVSIANQLEQFGDSIVSSGNASLSRFHVHSSNPAEVFKAVSDKGMITQSKAEDMLRQFQMLHQRKYPIALVTDSSADIPAEILEQYQIHLIPLNLQLDHHHLIDRITIDQTTFYDQLSALKTYPRTSYPSPALIEDKIRQLALHYEHVLVLPISQALSGMHDAIARAAQNQERVHVMNSRLTSGALGLLVIHAAQLIAEGFAIEEIKTRLNAKIAKINLFVFVDQFDSLTRSGRIGKLSALIGRVAHIKPIITLDEAGKGVLFDKAFTETKALEKLILHVNTGLQQQTLEAYGIVHAGEPEKAQAFARLTTQAFKMPPAFIEYVSPALGLHAGKGCIAVAAMRY